ncbi:MarR family transcriptional regulator [Simiduia curdlanivorans]|uniref:MarR family winged helix-turn-helix transcriptional regulator n=1 Tax=Simiduia curdlanivorans TaxID=1492769 RepID=A0ABV8V814_9GAMM|nr:MarR family transcriptional regulator [Simiduia curdlanivorans]MDN3638546.1 MarR family transcriptional regulator [Simiduia curdlanivorans]
MGNAIDDAKLVHLDQQLCFKLYAASRLVIRAYKPLLDSMGVTYPQYLVLMVLWQSESAVTVGHLGDKLMLDSGTLTPLIKRMEALGLVARQRGLEDERQVWVQLTDAGKALQPMAINWVKQVATATTEVDLVALRKQLDSLLEKIG